LDDSGNSLSLADFRVDAILPLTSFTPCPTTFGYNGPPTILNYLPSKRKAHPRILPPNEIVPYASATIQELEFGLPPTFQTLGPYSLPWWSGGRDFFAGVRGQFEMDVWATKVKLARPYEPVIRKLSTRKESRSKSTAAADHFAVGVTAATRAATTMTLPKYWRAYGKLLLLVP
jgi:hypothetical protein